MSVLEIPAIRMMIFGMFLFSAVTLSLSQESCECIAYFYCNSTHHEDNIKCDGELEVCCEVESETISFIASSPTPDMVPAADGGSICGMRGKDLGSIVGWKIFSDSETDTTTSFGEFPWMVAILKSDSMGKLEFLSGGSVIYPNIILTTAHSLSRVKPEEVKVKAGIWNTTSSTELAKHQDRSVRQIVLHSGFDQAKVANDVALLVLSEPLTITDNVAPICMPLPETPFNSSNCIATGWGASSFGNKSIQSILKKVTIPLVDRETCQRELQKVPRLGLNFKLHNSFICASGKKEDTCTGDGGGPLVCPTLADPDRYVQVGITSWGIGCGEGIPGVYSSVEVAATWIETLIDAFPGSRMSQKT